MEKEYKKIDEKNRLSRALHWKHFLLFTMQIFTRIRGHFEFIGLKRSETDENQLLNWRNMVVLYILFEYMALALKYLCTKAETLTEYADSFQVSATTTVNFFIFAFMVMRIPEMYDLMDDFELIIKKSKLMANIKNE